MATRTKNNPAGYGSKAARLADIVFNAEDYKVQFANEGDDTQIEVVGYSGRVIQNHPYWGNVAFDLTGMTFRSNRTPILENHDMNRRIGFATEQKIGQNVTFKGPFMENTNALGVKADMAKGFPFQASLRVPPSSVEYVDRGAAVQVNGHTLHGPGTVFRKSTVEEVSVTPIGWDRNTKSTGSFADDQQYGFAVVGDNNNVIYEQEKNMDIETLKKDHPELFAQVFDQGKAEGEAKERTLIADYFAKIEDPAAAFAAYKEGKDVATAAVEFYKAEAAKARAEKEEFAKKANDTTVTPPQKLTAAEQEFSDDVNNPDNKGKKPITGTPKTEVEMRKQFQESAQLQVDFICEDDYVAFCKASNAGLVEIHERKRV